MVDIHYRIMTFCIVRSLPFFQETVAPNVKLLPLISLLVVARCPWLLSPVTFLEVQQNFTKSILGKPAHLLPSNPAFPRPCFLRWCVPNTPFDYPNKWTSITSDDFDLPIRSWKMQAAEGYDALRLRRWPTSNASRIDSKEEAFKTIWSASTWRPFQHANVKGRSLSRVDLHAFFHNRSRMQAWSIRGAKNGSWGVSSIASWREHLERVWHRSISFLACSEHRPEICGSGDEAESESVMAYMIVRCGK